MNEGLNKQWRWVVLVSSFVLAVLLSPLFVAFGAFVLPWKLEFDASGAIVGAISSCASAISGFTCPAASYIVHKWGYRNSEILGGILLVVSFSSSSLVQSVFQLFLTYSVLGGLSQALCSMGYLNAMNDQLPDDLGPAVSIINSGYGIGGFVFPLLFQYLIGEYTWRGAMLVTAGILGNAIVCGYLHFPLSKAPPWPCTKNSKKSITRSTIRNQQSEEITFELELDDLKSTSDDKERMEACIKKNEMTYLEVTKILLTSKIFYLIAIHNILTWIGFFIGFAITPIRAYFDCQLTSEQVTTLVSTFGISQFFFRGFYAIVAHFKWLSSSTIYFSCHVMAAIATFLSLLATSFILQILYCIAISAAFSSMGFYIVLVRHALEPYAFTAALGYLEIMHGIGSVLGPLIGGALFDVTGTTFYSFLLAGCALLFGTLFLVLGLILVGRRDKLNF